ncbi:transcriptional regulator [Bacillus canaveralius]|uniref:Transcriptional regulator n=1 Tax=Bacillus canaveralius TaxID=1403243 RepID=A0A2N5GND3_9BACI|nr:MULTISPECIES: helix-turn-helix transcriptional regulator [Bacillus]PLR84025.1 transcriptional regulator [Bacillus canaveralius]PLR87257.1 transcriptional regulator [Bacillus sp. V33-4]PLR96330.1 transcriptional regulator [Bacillus canaveralius]RSK53486.1 XRE family transcriptional regulator [Bacillus canaveralius]
MIGKNIYEIRKKRGLSLTELAERACISKSYLSNIERNLNQNPSIQVMNKLALALDVDLNTLLISATNLEKQQLNEKEWLDLVNQLKESGIDKGQINDYKTLIAFFRWKNQNS